MEFVEVFIDKYNLVIGAIVAIFSFLLGDHWVLFAAFLLFNIIDWITGWMKSRMMGVENSAKGAKGVLKKLGYWIMIAVAFGMSTIFMEIGQTIGIDLKITTILGWFVLASLIINEIRSILENFVEAGFNVPAILIKGLEVAEKVIESENPIAGSLDIDTTNPDKDIYKINLDIPLEDLGEKEHVTLKVNKTTEES